MTAIGILGGTFDPIHYGHLRTALEVQTALGLEQVRFVPSARPPHRPAPGTPPELRAKLVGAAIADRESFVLDEREISREGPSYTVDTLASLRDEFPDRPLVLVLGADAFLGLPEWHRWERVTDYAHIVVARRPGWPLPRDGEIGALLSAHRAAGPEELKMRRSGRIHIQDVTQLEISASTLRASIAAGIEPKYLLPDNVWAMIRDTGCYANQD
jgi:nicotinate-nucleotide adenylyltransferase